MSTASGFLTVGDIDVDVVYKDIKHLHIGVYPPLGRVRVAAPKRLEEDHVRLAVIQRLAWIRRQRRRLQAVSRQSVREMVTGESHYVWGVRRRLRVIKRPGRPHVELDGERLLLYVAADTDVARRRTLLQDWQRAQLRAAIPPLLTRWEPIVGRSVTRWTIRQMKTRWGSCNRETARISLNLALSTKHPDCLEYVLVHELVHLLERGHGTRFTQLMDGLIPDWRRRRAELNCAPLADERWTPLATAVS
jgi:predicted metal-dependent hydrolase